MGSGASAIQVAVNQASEDDVKLALQSLARLDRKKLEAVFGADDEPKTCPAKTCPRCPCANMNGQALPEAMTDATTDLIVATTAAVAPKALDITKTFYKGMIADHPGEILQFFNPAHNLPISEHQPRALSGAVCAYASNIKDLTPLLVPGGPMDAINHRHCALNIFPGQYPIVHDHLMDAIWHELGAAVTEDVAKAWSEAVRFLAKVCIDKEEALYKEAEARQGGWRGLKHFTVSEIVEAAADIKTFTFMPVEAQADGFDFFHGQYLSLKVDPEGNGLTAPRHYTITSAPGEKFLQCTVKKISGGKVSTFLHETVKVGDIVKLSPPFGVFTLDSDASSAVLMSAGIGVTPMMSFSRALAEKVKLTMHVDKSPEVYAFRSHFESSPERFVAKYTKTGDAVRPSSEALAKEAVEKAGTDNVFYICGPEAWMNEVQGELLKLGAKKVMCEVFGSQLATTCPFAASA